MSFSSRVKQEFCKAKLQHEPQKQAMCYGLLLFGRSFGEKGISLQSECVAAVKLAADLLAELTGAIVSTQTALRRATHAVCTLSVPDSGDVLRVLSYFGHTGREVHLRLNRANLEEDTTLVFLRGAFLACGTAFDPEKHYRVEFVTPRMHLAQDLCTLLLELPLSLHVRLSRRGASYVVYLHGEAGVEDFLTALGAPNAAMDVMQARMFKEVRNQVNRRTNFEAANIAKTASAAARPIRALQTLFASGGTLESLPPELRALARLRYENPDLSLRELGQRLDPPLSRSGVNHRLQRITQIAEKAAREKTGASSF